MAVAAVGAALGAFILEVLIKLGVQNPLRQRLLQVVEQTVSLAKTSFGSRPASSWSKSSFSIAM
jgi:hypothetical protein